MENNTLIEKERSFAACIRDAYTLMAGQMGKVFLSSWKPLLIVSLIAGIVIAITPSPFTIVNSSTYYEEVALKAIACILAILIVLVCWRTTVDAQAVHLITGSTARKNAGRALKFNLMKLLGGATIGLLTAGIACLPLIYSAWSYMMNPEKKAWGIYGRDYLTGWRHFGYVFMIALLTILSVLPLMAILLIPSVVIMLATNDYNAGVILGDSIELPTLFPAICALFYTLTLFVSAYIFIWIDFVGYLGYSSLRLKKQHDK